MNAPFIYRLLLVVAIATALSAAKKPDKAETDKAWKEFKTTHNRKYKNTVEEKLKRRTFEDNLNIIYEHNDDPSNTYTLGINDFADMSNEEYQEIILTKFIAPGPAETGNNGSRKKRQTLPLTVDIRTTGCVAPIKHQGKCGSCWAFAAVAAVEAAVCLKNNRKLVRLSEQDVVDCTYQKPEYYNPDGCNGGYVESGYRYAKHMGIDTEVSYPYNATVGSCKHDNSTIGGKILTWACLDSSCSQNNPAAMQQNLANNVVLTVMLNASASTFQFYQSGVYKQPDCTTNINHAVVIVGYGTEEETTPYWLMRNSWGTSWGEQGYMRIERNANTCQIERWPRKPVT